MTSHRPERVGDVIREALARALREDVRDPRIGFVTLTGIDLSPDLRNARVYVSTLSAGAARDETLAALRRAAPFLRRTLARQTRLRRVPSLEFLWDASLETGSRVERLLSDMRDEPEDPEESR